MPGRDAVPAKEDLVAYAISLEKRKAVTGFFIAMSVFKPAEQALAKAGSKVKLATYEGGHGWRGPLYDWIRQGIAWLDENRAGAGPGRAGTGLK